ncbi:MAG: hypothetical protein JSR85_01755 [Proteobacteria bacterium]|nr:hypothetical protein [Pseudomonadota bacterium]
MKINFPALFKTPLHKYTFFFIFGNDETVFERTISFIQKQFSSRFEIRTEDDLATNAPKAPSLFDERTSSSLTFVPHVTDKLLKIVDQLKKGHFIFTSEKARSQSKLVTYFSQSSTSLAIAAYASPLTTSEFEFLVEEVNLPTSFKMLLFKAYQNDYMGLITTLEKIKLYGEVPADQFECFLEASLPSDELTPLIHGFLIRNVENTIRAFSSTNPSDLIPFLRTLSRSFQILFELMPFKRSPKSISWHGLSSPVFFKDQPLYETALSKWQPEEVLFFLETLLMLEREVKFSGFSLPQVQAELVQIL